MAMCAEATDIAGAIVAGNSKGFLQRGESHQAVQISQGPDASALISKRVSFVTGVVVDLAWSLEPALLHSVKWEAISASARCSHFCASIKYFQRWGRTPPTDGTENPWRDSVQHFPLQAPPLHIDSLFRRLRKSHYDYARELFFGFLDGGLAISLFERQHKLGASVAHVA